MELIKANANDLPYIYSQMEKNFIRDEIREYEDARRVFDNEKYTIYHIHENGVDVGFMCVWSLSQFAFLEHFVVYEEHRGKGKGGRALEMLKNNKGTVILECEPPVSPMQKRRVNFYLRHGMVMNERDYWQPAYRPDGERCYLKLVCSEDIVRFDDVVREIYREVYGIDHE